MISRDFLSTVWQYTGVHTVCRGIGAVAAMAENSSLQGFDPRKYLDQFYGYSVSKKPGEEPELLEFTAFP